MLYVCCCIIAAALSSAPITLVVDASKAPMQNIVRTHEVIPVNPGPLTLYYPQRIPGEHSPAGPIQNVAELVITANGKRLARHRDGHFVRVQT